MSEVKTPKPPAKAKPADPELEPNIPEVEPIHLSGLACNICVIQVLGVTPTEPGLWPTLCGRLLAAGFMKPATARDLEDLCRKLGRPMCPDCWYVAQMANLDHLLRVHGIQRNTPI